MMILPDVNGLTVSRAAMAYVEAGIPIVPFDPTRGNGKQCGNLVGNPHDPADNWYSSVTTDKDTIRAWRKKFGRFQALATSPGEFGCVVIDVDKPNKFPRKWRGYLESVPFVSTRPNEHKRRGHYWFTTTPTAPAMSNRTFAWGELRAVGGGIVLPPYQNPDTKDARTVVRAGSPPLLPDELHTAFIAGAGGVGQLADLAAFISRYGTSTDQKKERGKLKGIEGLYRREARFSRHNAARAALTVGFSEARIGYVSARNVYDLIRSQWNKPESEFRKLAQWCATVAQETELQDLKDKSDRTAGTDSRQYRGHFS